MTGAFIERTHAANGTVSSALYSPCGKYRYRLTRRWGDGAELLFIMLNPSKATETANDPTIERCQRRACRTGYAALSVVNLFAWRETSPRLLARASEPVGPENDRIVHEAAASADTILAAWGVHGALGGRGPRIAAELRARGLVLRTLGLTQGGHPRHPLYVSYARGFDTWDRPETLTSHPET